MIEAMRGIGEYVEKRADSNLLDVFVDNLGKGYKWVLLVMLKEEKGGYTFRHVELEEFKGEDYKRRYLYKAGSPRGTDVTPTSKIAENLEKTFQNKFLKWFENYAEYKVSESEKKEIKKMLEALKSRKEDILAQLRKKSSQVPKNENAIITLGIEKNGKRYYIGDFPFFQDVLLQKGKENYYYQKSKGISLGKNSVCSVCKERREEVYGCAIPWGFHTFDKPGYIAGGFKFTDSWKNTPVCFECATHLEMGKKYIEDNLNFGFYGFRYLLIPKLTVQGEYGEILDILEDYKKKVRLNQEVRNQITADEEEILGLVAEQKNFFNNNLLFYKKDQSAFRILLFIEGILPSRLRELFDAKDRVDKLFEPLNKLLLTDKQKDKRGLWFNFGTLRQFFPKSQNMTFDKMFLEVVGKIFVGDYIDYDLIMWAIMQQVRSVFVDKDRKPTNFTSLSGFLLLHYINELNLFKELKGDEMDMKGDELFGVEEYESMTLEDRVEALFDRHKAFFNNNAKKAVFLEGVLTQFLLNIQYEEKGDTPFRTKLHGLKLNEKLVKRLLPEIQNKLEEYGKNYYKELESLIAQYFVLAGDEWDIGDDELSFYFVLGMDMSKLFKNPEKTKRDDTSKEVI
ncbi:MAG TPA: TIGR02556 family CRISPR-associated protein [Candidatus Syntrophoarchaeum butanivorans]|uniref:TIGR02556 family CRISPR-associated protein n=1 Tax=Candidatus Syntropharchaeum butanivorans TaxID=1839936 RepID=A0A7J2RZ71_9EURY|nr:TIGR02556 family CRISPR-associated protein [Candidatus Syntrophoarchaeum butanivorans]